MLSDLAKSIKGVALTDQDDHFLVTHLLAGDSELVELSDLIAKLQAREKEARAIQESIEETLLERFADGKIFTMGTAVVTIQHTGGERSPRAVLISQAEVLPLPSATPAERARPDPASPRRIK